MYTVSRRYVRLEVGIGGGGALYEPPAVRGVSLEGMRGGAWESLKREKSDLLVSSLRARAAEESKENPEPELEESDEGLEAGLELEEKEPEPFPDEPEEYFVPEPAL